MSTQQNLNSIVNALLEHLGFNQYINNFSPQSKETIVVLTSSDTARLEPDVVNAIRQVSNEIDDVIQEPVTASSQNVETNTNIQWFLAQEPENLYFQFLASIQPYPANTLTHTHHILPKYLFRLDLQLFYNNAFNLCTLSIPDHKRAHEILFELYGDPRDQGAAFLLQGNQTDALVSWRRAGGFATQQILRQEGRTVYDQNWQREMAQRSMQRPDALQIRSEGGRRGGRQRNINRIINKNQRFLFKWQGKPCLCIINCETGGEVLEQLQLAHPTNIERVTALLNGTRKYAYGWSCEPIVT